MATKKAQAAVDDEIAHFKAIQTEIGALESTRQQLVTQMNENGMVKAELDLLEDGAPVYKLVGPALIKQELTEAKSDVNRRIEFIKAETEKALTKHSEKVGEAEAKRNEIIELQQKMQASAAAAAKEAAEKAMAGN